VATDKPESDEEGKEDSQIKMPSIEQLLNFIQDKDARLGLVLSVFLLFLLVFVWLSRSYGGVFEGGFSEVIRAFGVFLLSATAFVIFFKAIDGSILPRIIVWYFTSLILLTVSAFWIQAILRSPTPYLIDAKCFIDLWSQGCPLGTSLAQPIAVASSPEEQSSQGSTSKVPYIPPTRNKVFVQFAGSLSRDDVTRVSMALTKESWNMDDADRGGERTAQAGGIDQVRYFHAEDLELAKQLAASYNKLATWKGFDELAVAYVSGYESRMAVGRIEVWTSVD